MTVAKATARCPYCREPIQPGATRCKHCHAELETSNKRTNPLTRLNTFRTGFLSGVLFSIIVAILLYAQFFGAD